MASTNTEAGFSLVEVAVALTIISVGVIGTISLVGTNRALMETAWMQGRMALVADSVMTEIAAVYRRGDALTTTTDYDVTADPQDFELLPIFTDNGFVADASTLAIATGTAPIDFKVTLTLVSPAGRSMTRTLSLYEPIN